MVAILEEIDVVLKSGGPIIQYKRDTFSGWSN